MSEICFFLPNIPLDELCKAILNETLYYVQCKQFQFVNSVLFGQVRRAVIFGHW